MTLVFEKRDEPCVFNVMTSSGQQVGEIVMLEDGFYYFFPTKEFHGGYWPTWVLQVIIDKIKELDTPYEEEINKFFNENP